ncbi:MAG: CPBP family intramembrane metalloprotease [Nitrososphaerota archaeon]|nr:CPBP family intramembrane metalloprotease [Nitrososphaerota archaeon]
MTRGMPIGSLFVSGTVLVLLLLTLALAIFSFPAGVYTVFHSGLSTQYSSSTLVLTYLWVGPAPVLIPYPAALGELFVLLLGIYAALIAYTGLQETRPLQATKDAFAGGAGRFLKSPLFVVLTAIGFVSFTGVVITDVSQALLGSVGNPFSNADPLLTFYSLTIAPLREEIGFRVVLIGAVAFLLSAGRPFKTALKALWRPSVLFEGAAVGGVATAIFWAAFAGSAVTFGVCHVNCVGGGGGWTWAKFPYALWGGVVLGYLYVKYGLPVAILTHWGVDYLGTVYSYFGQSAFGIPANSATTEYVLQYLYDFDVVFLIGIASFVLVTYLSVKWLLARRAGPEGSFLDKGAETAPPLST